MPSGRKRRYDSSDDEDSPAANTKKRLDSDSEDDIDGDANRKRYDSSDSQSEGESRKKKKKVRLDSSDDDSDSDRGTSNGKKKKKKKKKKKDKKKKKKKKSKLEKKLAKKLKKLEDLELKAKLRAEEAALKKLQNQLAEDQQLKEADAADADAEDDEDPPKKYDLTGGGTHKFPVSMENKRFVPLITATVAEGMDVGDNFDIKKFSVYKPPIDDKTARKELEAETKAATQMHSAAFTLSDYLARREKERPLELDLPAPKKPDDEIDSSRVGMGGGWKPDKDTWECFKCGHENTISGRAGVRCFKCRAMWRSGYAKA